MNLPFLRFRLAGIALLALSVLLGVGASSPARAESKAPSASASAEEPLFFESDGARIHYVVAGEGEPVLLIHGFSANIGVQWKGPGVIDALSDRFRVIAYDNRGHGKSSKPHDPAQYGDKMALDAIAMLDHLGIEKAHFVGYSMGGFITARLLALAPERMLSATLGGAGWPRNDDPNRNSLLELADSLDANGSFAPLLNRLRPADQPPLTDEAIANMSRMMAMMNDVKALAATIRGMSQFSLSEDQVRAVTVPTLAIIGERDPLKDTVDPLAGVLPGVRIVVIPQADHMNAFTNELFRTTLRDFLVERSAAGSGGDGQAE